jgi:hypothetical protein
MPACNSRVCVLRQEGCLKQKEGVNTVEMIKTAATEGPHSSTSGTAEYMDNREAHSSKRTSTKAKADSRNIVRHLQQPVVKNIRTPSKEVSPSHEETPAKGWTVATVGNLQQ